MSERDWSKAGYYPPDPGKVVSVNDTGGIWCGNDDRPFVPKSQQLRNKAAKARKRRARARKRAAAQS